MKKIISLIAILWGINPINTVFCQESFVLTSLKLPVDKEDIHPSFHENIAKNKWQNSLSSSIISFYKTYISPQDLNNCAFHPSCSSFAAEAIAKKGIWIGYAAFWDRFTRCHGFSSHHYTPYQNGPLLHDPVH